MNGRQHAAEPARPPWLLPALVLAQLGGTSLWFAGNAVVADLLAVHERGEGGLAWVMMAVQLGFVAGTLLSARFAIADRVSPRWLFIGSTLAGAGFNLALLAADGMVLLLVCRFLTGLCLAGIYPVGLRLAASWYRDGLGWALGLLVGALVLGTALPHLLRTVRAGAPGHTVVMYLSLVAVGGALLVALGVPDGPYLRATTRLRAARFDEIFRRPRFRASALAYFGHMWELYTFWALLPALLARYTARGTADALDVPWWCFCVMAAGALSCIGGGALALRFGGARVAAAHLLGSGVCCVLLPSALSAPKPVFLGFLLLWGMLVVGDSPQLSALSAETAPRERVGSALAVTTAIGFALTVVSIHLTTALLQWLPLEWIFPAVGLGPLLGVISLRPLLQGSNRWPAKQTVTLVAGT